MLDIALPLDPDGVSVVLGVSAGPSTIFMSSFHFISLFLKKEVVVVASQLAHTQGSKKTFWW